MRSVIAIVPTYNRTLTLIKCVSSILRQTYPVKKIVIVDNNSNLEHKNIIKKLAGENPEIIDVLFMDDNYGGAGGFEKGVKYAFEKYSPEFYWLMDDDAYPTENCLENLIMSYEKLVQKEVQIGALAPVIFGVDKLEYQLYHHKKIHGLTLKEKSVKRNFDELANFEMIDANAFVGLLVPRQTIELVGFPDGSLFIYGDDTEYTLRISKTFGLKIYLVKDSVINHQDVLSVGQNIDPKSWWKEYYMIRNKYLIFNRLNGNFLKRICFKFIFTGIQVKSLIAASLKRKYKGYRLIRFKIIAKAVFDGIKLRSGKTLKPEEFINTIEAITNRKMI